MCLSLWDLCGLCKCFLIKQHGPDIQSRRHAPASHQVRFHTPPAAIDEFCNRFAWATGGVPGPQRFGQIVRIAGVADSDRRERFAAFRYRIKRTGFVRLNADHLVNREPARRRFEHQISSRESQVMNCGTIRLVIPCKI